MHIGFISHEYPHSLINSSAGIGSCVKNIAQGLVEKGYKVTIFVYAQDCNMVFNEQGITIHKIAYKKYFLFSWFLYRKELQHYINKIINIEKINVIEAPDYYGITAFMSLNAPLIIRLHGSDTFFCHLEKRQQKGKNKFFEKRALLTANEIVGVSNFVVEKTKSIFNIMRPVNVIYNTINTDDFIPDHSQIEKSSLLYFGTLIRKKGILELAHIFNKIIEQNSSVKLTILGRDTIDVLTRRSTLSLFKEILTKKAIEQINYIPNVSYDKVKKHISKVEVVVVPSLAESFGLVTIEAMAMEKAVVASNYPWNKEIIIDEVSGKLESPLEHANFADKILYLINNRPQAKKMGKAARERIEKGFNYNTILEQNIALYKSMYL